MKLPEYVREIIHKLEAAGFEAFAVGGCVRDALLSRPSSDYDVTTSAKPQEVKAALSGISVIETGIKHGTVTAVLKENLCEITTYRQDVSYSDHRRPDAVLFSNSIADDLKRRDFTINALAFNEKSGLVDLFSGKNDLEKGIIRAVGNADERIQEDALRSLRAIRFCAQLGFEIEEKTLEAINKNRELLSFVSKERIYSELKKTLLGKNAQGALFTGREVILFVLPVLKNSDFAASLSALCRLTEDFSLRFAALFYGADADAAVEALHSLKAEKKVISEVKALLSTPPIKKEMSRAEIKKLLCEKGEQAVLKRIELELSFANEQEAERLKKVKDTTESIINSGECYKLSQLKIGGKELVNLSKEPSAIGGILEKLVLSVINGEIQNDTTELIEKAKRL